MKKMCVLVGLISFLAAQTVWAGGQWKEGKAVFKQNCKECHGRSATAGGRLKISEHNQDYWANCITSPQDELHQKQFDALSAAEKDALLKYFFKYASKNPSEQKKKLGC